MNEQALKNQCKQIYSLLIEKRLKEAIALLSSLVNQCSHYELSARVDQLQTSYQYMLQYMEQGADDPNRDELYRKLIVDAFDSTDQLQVLMLDTISYDIYHAYRKLHAGESYYLNTEHLNLLELLGQELKEVKNLSADEKTQLNEKLEEQYKAMFMSVFTTLEWTDEIESELSAFMESDDVPLQAKVLCIWAVAFNTQRCFNINRYVWIIRGGRTDNLLLALICRICHFFLARQYASRLQFYPEIKQQMDIIAKNPKLIDSYNNIVIQFNLCLETEKIDKKMREEIIPQMMKGMNAARFDNDEFEESDDINPDWEKMMNLDPETTEKLREMNSLQMEGADIYWSSFSMMKTFPFFRELIHWFYIFDENYAELYINQSAAKDENSMVNLLLNSAFFCSSDKFSLYHILQQVPESQRKMLFSQLTEQQMEEFSSSDRIKEMKSIAAKEGVILNHLMQDLYRFYKLSPFRTAFTDMFNENAESFKLEVDLDLFEENHLYSQANFFFKQERWEKAIALYTRVIDRNGKYAINEELYQHMGLALQKLKRIPEAIAAYKRADILKSDVLWTTRHLATCYRLDKNYKQALSYYEKAQHMVGDNADIIFFIANCMAELNRFDEALNTFFKLDFIEPDSLRASKGIAWCSFMERKYEQAEKYYQKIIANGAKAIDYLNAGHTAWCSKHMQETVRYYKQAAQQFATIQSFRDTFSKDIPVLIDHGVNPSDIPLMLDLVN